MEEKINPLFIGIGNRLRSDDGAGSILAERLQAKANIIDAGTTPENYLAKIVALAPSQLWIIDALDFSGQPGSWKVFNAAELSSEHLFFTHNSSLELFCSYLKGSIDIPMFIIGIQPGSLKFSDKLSRAVEVALDDVEKLVFDISQGKGLEQLIGRHKSAALRLERFS
jgi:hydrogenase maturation protease HycI